MVVAAPLVAEYAVGPTAGAAPQAAAAFNSGDYIVVIGVTSALNHKLGTPSGPPVDAWNRVQIAEATSWGNGYAWVARCTANWSGTLSISIAQAGSAGANDSMFWSWRYDGRSSGFDATGFSRLASGTAAGVTLTTSSDNCAIMFGVVDWNASAFTNDTQTLRIPAGNVGSAIKNYGLHTASANWSYGRYTDVGVAGDKLVGIASPSNWKSTIVAVAVKGDLIAPSAVSNLQAVLASASSVTVTWDAATDNTGVTAYRVYDFGTQIGADIPVASPRSYTHTGLLPMTSHQYTVRALDASGNLGGVLDSKTVQIPGIQKAKWMNADPKLYQGTNQVSKLYVGTTQIWP